MSANFLRTGAEWLAARAKASLSNTVTYRRGANSVTLSATYAQKVLRIGDAMGGSRVVRTERDYKFTAADLILGGAQVTPQKGDKITDANDPDGVSRVWEVLSPGGDEPEWQYADPFREAVRVHTKLLTGA